MLRKPLWLVRILAVLLVCLVHRAVAQVTPGAIYIFPPRAYVPSLPPPGNGLRYTKVAVGINWGLALRSDGVVVPVGNVSVPSGLYRQIAMEGSWGALLRTDGHIAITGNGPTPGPSVTAVEVDAGGDLGAAVLPTGQLYFWGTGASNFQARTPQTSAPWIRIAVAIGGLNVVGIRSDGSLASWGPSQTVPAPAGEFREAVAAYNSFLALRTDGTLVAWGDTSSITPLPTGTFLHVDLGDGYGVAVRTNGEPVVWGSRSGQFQGSRPAAAVRYLAARFDFAAAIIGAPPPESIFTYQGELTYRGSPLFATADVRFKLFDEPTAGSQFGNTLQVRLEPGDLINGRFTAELDFGQSAMDGSARYLEIAVRSPATGSSGSEGMSTLSPRQRLSPVPFAMNVVGQQGAQGERGEQGLPGEQGPTGEQGPQGDMGPTGAQGPAGPTGLSGAPGPTGATGPVGLNGRDGAIGPTGRNGAAGPPGAPGRDGARGATGSTGVAGATGPIGNPGPTGAPGSADAWSRTGNAGTLRGTNFIGTTDAVPFEIRVNGERVWQSEVLASPTGNSILSSVNTLGGSRLNAIGSGVTGATIAGGGGTDSAGGPWANFVTDVGGTVGGGVGNRAGSPSSSPNDAPFATIGGGKSNMASGAGATVSGGVSNNVYNSYASIVGGLSNSAYGENSVVGGFGNNALGLNSVVMGGSTNTAYGSAAAVLGGAHNNAGGDYSFAGGNNARVRSAAEVGGGDLDGDAGSFVWADDAGPVFSTTGARQFLVRAGGGLGVNTNAPRSTLDVAGQTTTNALRIPGGTSGQVLISDASGNATWGAATTIPTGPAGGDLSGLYPNPTIAPGAVGNAEISDVAWAKVTGAPSSFPPNGAAGGDLIGTYPAPSVAKLAGRSLGSTAPTDGQVLKWNQSAAQWQAAADANSVYTSGAGLTLTGNAFSISTGGVLDGMIASVSWGKVTGAPSSFPPSGAASGDLTGTYPAPSVSKLAGRSLGVTAPTDGQVLKWNQSAAQWQAAADANSVYTSGAGLTLTGNAFSIPTGAVVDGMIASVSWGKVTGAPSSLPPTGTASGDLSGTYPAPSVAKLAGRSLGATAPTDGQVLKWNQSAAEWQAALDANSVYSSGAGLTLSGNAFSIPTGGVVDGMIASVSWGKVTGAPSSLPPSGMASGDLSGTYPAPTVARLAGRALGSAAPTDGQVLKWNQSAAQWQAAADANSIYTSGAGLTLTGNAFSIPTGGVLDGMISSVSWGKVTGTPSSLPPSGAAGGDLTGSYPNPGVQSLRGWRIGTGTPTSGAVLMWNQAVAEYQPTPATGVFWRTGGNNGMFAGVNFMGTTDGIPLELRTNNERSVLYTSTNRVVGSAGPSSMNVLGGYTTNSMTAGVVGGTIGGGGSFDNNLGRPLDEPNRVTDDFGTVSGGAGNRAGDGAGSAFDSPYDTVAGGRGNAASGGLSVVGGGGGNFATGGSATVSGGSGNQATGAGSTIPGGSSNIASGSSSFAAGTNANAAHNNSFVWADGSGGLFSSTGVNQFRVRSAGGATFNVGAASIGLTVTGTSPAAALFTSSSTGGTSLAVVNNSDPSTAVWTLTNTGTGSGVGFGKLQFGRNGVSGAVLAMDGAGNVGVGTSSPGQNFSVANGMNVDQNELNAGTIASTLRFGAAQGGEGIGSNRTSDAAGNRYGLDLYTSSLRRVSITADGNVGIGNYAPGEKLTVQDGPIGLFDSLDSKTWRFAYDNVSNYFYIDEYGVSRRFVIANGGNVGIGLTNPAAKLHVSGNVRIDGNVTVSGNVSGGSKTFAIDHPADPLNKTLRHACIESDQYTNLYRGTVMLDSGGEAVVTLPAWFEQINEDFSYQLTAVGAAMPLLHVGSEIEGGAFRIAGGAPGHKVSWLVTGVRKDPYAKAHPLTVEEDKVVKGEYLHPEAYGSAGSR